MRRAVLAYFSTIIPLIMIDAVWLTLTGQPLYQAQLGGMLLDQPVVWAAIAFYLVYAAGVVILVVLPAVEAEIARIATARGAVLGFVAYATYDLTNIATLKNWSGLVTGCDLVWGTILTAIAASVSYQVTRRWG
jgi:uncharacterized membrane protein